MLPDTDILFGKLILITPAVVIVPPVTVSVLLATVIAVTVPPDPVVLIVTLPLLLLRLIPVPAAILVTPVLVTVIVPLLVIGLFVTNIPVPGVMPTLVTVPATVLLLILVTLPKLSTPTVGLLYVPAVIPVVGRLSTILPALNIGLLLTDNVVDVTPTLCTPPPPLPPPVAVIVMLPFEPVKLILLSPAVKLNTPVLVIVTILVFGLAFTVTPILPANALYGLAHANNVAKLVTVLLNAVYSESLLADSFCNPTAITCCPEIAIF